MVLRYLLLGSGREVCGGGADGSGLAYPAAFRRGAPPWLMRVAARDPAVARGAAYGAQAREQLWQPPVNRSRRVAPVCVAAGRGQGGVGLAATFTWGASFGIVRHLSLGR